MWSRKFHRLAAWITFIPIIIIFCTGVILQMKPWLPWLQPPAKKGTAIHADVGLNTLLELSQSVKDAKVASWKDIRSIDVRPGNGIARVRTKSEYEISIDLGKLQVVQAAQRRTSFLIELHEGSYFGEKIKYGIFLPSAILLLGIWFTGIWLLVRPSALRMKKKFKTSVHKPRTMPRSNRSLK